MGQHKDITVAKGVHISHAFTFADATARNAASGLVAADEGKIARQLDDDSFHVLQDSTVPTWAAITAGGGAPVGAEFVVISLDATLTAERRLQAEVSVLSLTDAGANADVTIGVLANGISNAKLRDSAGTSVMGKASAGTGDPADIIAGVNDRVLSRAGGVLAFTLLTTAMLTNGAVTFAKMQDIATDRLIGRDTAATGDPEEISVAGGLEFTGSGGIQRSALTGDVTAAAGSNATTIAANAVTDTKLRDSAGTSVIGNFDSGTGNPADIVAAADNVVLQRLGGSLSFSVLTILSENLALTGDITPSSLAANQNNYTPSGAYTTASTLRQASSANVDITGLTGGSDGRIIIFHNIGTFDITLKNQDGSSTAANRFALNADVVLAANNSALLQYDSTASRWRVVSTSIEGAGGGGAPVGASYVVIALDGTLTAERRLQAESGVLELTDEGANGDITVGVVTGGITDAKLRNSAALSVIGRSANSGGVPADIAATVDGQVLRRAGTTLGFGTIATAGIADEAVTFAKLQHIATDRLVGRDTAATGDPEEITVAGGLEFTGSGGIQRSALTGDVTAGAGSNTTAIAANVVGNTELRDSAGTSVIGKATSGTGDPADIVASADNQVLQRLGGALSFAVFDTISEAFLLTGSISPAALAANTNDWAPTGLATASVIRATASAAINVTGLTGGGDGRIIAIYNIGTTNPITLTDDDAASAADNRFQFDGDIILEPGAGVILIYDDVPSAGSKRWRGIGRAKETVGGAVGVNEVLFGDTRNRAQTEAGFEYDPATNILTTDNLTTTILRVDADDVVVTGTDAQILVKSGAAGGGLPQLAQDAENNSGVRWDGAGTVQFLALGVAYLQFSASGVRVLAVGFKNIDGNASAPSYTFQTSPNMGMFKIAVNDLGFATTGLQRFSIDPNGNVVVGVAAHAGTAQSSPYFYTPTVPGTPTGTPTTFAGLEPTIINDSDDRFAFRASSSWHELDPTAILNEFSLPGDITPSTVSINQNNYTPSGAYSTASTLRQASSANVDITGLTGGSDGRIIIIHNIGIFTITLKTQNASSSLANRFALNADIILAPDNAAVLQYDSTSSRWRAVASSVEASGGGGAPAGAQYVVIALDGTLTAERRLQVGSGLTLTDGGANGDVTLEREVLVDLHIMGDATDVPNNSAWTGSSGVPAPYIDDEDDLDLKVLAYDDTVEEGRGFDAFVPTGVVSFRITFVSRRRTSTGGATAVKPELHRKKYPDNAAPDSSFTGIGGSGIFTKLDYPASVEHYQYDTQTITISDLGITANNFYNFELTRNVGHADDNTIGDWYLKLIRIEMLAA